MIALVLCAVACAGPAREVVHAQAVDRAPPVMPLAPALPLTEGPYYQNELGFRVWLPAAPEQLPMKEPGVVSLSASLEKGMAFVHVHPRAENTDTALKAVADEFLQQLPAASERQLASIQMPGADAAFAMTFKAETMGVVVQIELRAARRDGDLAIWAVVTTPGMPQAKKFLSSFTFTERGVYIDPVNAFRIAIPPGWEFVRGEHDDAEVVLHRGHRPTQQVITIRNVAMQVDSESLDQVAAGVARAMIGASARPGRMRKQIIQGRKTVDLWWQESEQGRSYVSLVRCIVFRDRTLTSTIVSADVTEPTPAAQRLLESFQPLPGPTVSTEERRSAAP